MYVLMKSVVLLLVLLGYGMLYQKKRLPICFFQMICVSGISLVLYVFGLLGQLKLGCYAIVAGGLLMLAIYGKPNQVTVFLKNPSIWFSVLSGVWLYVITSGTMLSRWDDGTHWYRICKSIFYENAFPTTIDILFYDYVPGIQTWDYFILQFIGFSIPHCFFAQSLVNIACVTTLFSGLRNVKDRTYQMICLGMIGIAAIKLCGMTVGTYTLKVDLQVGLVAMAALIFMLDQGDADEAAVPLTVMLAFLAIIKNSGVLFVAVIIIWAVFRYRLRGKMLIVRFGLWCGVSAAVYAAYKLRSVLVYHSFSGGAQGISPARYAKMLAEKNAETIWEFTSAFLGKVFLDFSGQNITLLICIALMMLLILVLRKVSLRVEAAQVCQNLIGLSVMMGLYLVSLYATYLLSMTAKEALKVNAFNRYYGTAILIFAGAALYTALCQVACMAQHARRLPSFFALGITLFAVIGMRGLGSDEYILGRDRWNMPVDHDPSVWYALQDYVPENKFYTENSYVVLWDKNDFKGDVLENLRIGYNAGAWLRSVDILVFSNEDLAQGFDENVLEWLNCYDYLVCMSDMTGKSAELEAALGTNDFSVGMRAIAP